MNPDHITEWLLAFALTLVAVAVAVAVVRHFWRAARQFRRMVDEEAPRPDFAFLANCLWCADLSEEPLDCNCRYGCTEVEWCVARYDATNTSVGSIPVYPEDGRG